MAQLIKNLPAVQETWVQYLDWDDPLEKGKATHSIVLAWRIPGTVLGRKELDTTERLSLTIMECAAMQETQVQLDQEDPLEKGMATYSSILAWRIPWTEEPGELRVVKSQTRLSHSHTHTHLNKTNIKVNFQ